jgi:hypothetical protein
LNPLVRIAFRIAAASLGFFLVGPLRAQALWPNTRAGMSVDEVQKLYPEAHEPAEPGELPAAHGTELLELDDTVIAEHHFKVRFFFNEARLVHVDLFETAEMPMKEFERFRDLLRAKYGLEYSTTSSESIRLDWHAIKTVIRLQWTPVARGVATLSITYDAPIPKDNERL